jgi:hypothetical protein
MDRTHELELLFEVSIPKEKTQEDKGVKVNKR